MPNTTIHGDGNAPNILTDLRDIGRFVSRIIADDRTLNKYVYTWSDILTENEILNIVEELSGEKIETQYVCMALHLTEHILTSYFIGECSGNGKTTRRCPVLPFS